MVAPGLYMVAEPALRQTVSPQLIAQSQILELSADELLERVRQELESNPALEVVDEALPYPLSRSVPEVTGAVAEATEALIAPYTLADDLRLQLAQVPADRRAMCDYLVDCLDERGFLDFELPAMAERFGVSSFAVEAAVQALQALEPAGIGARNLCECLLLEVRRFARAEVPEGTEGFITMYLSTVRRHSPASAAAALELSDQQLAGILRFIGSRLYMWPADRFQETLGARPAGAQPVVPDAWVTNQDGSLQVRVAQSWSRSLRVSAAYTRLDNEWQRATDAISTEERERLAEKVRSAQVFIHYLTRREAVLKRVTEAIVKRQQEFFSRGASGLQSLTRKDIAGALQVHESTISRITREKYVQLPDDRLVPFDYFFDGSVAAKTELRELIADEDPAHPRSDAELAKLMLALGRALARRTVAKYRDALGIPPANRRRRQERSRCPRAACVPALA
jgi:RNA polymerase sigma-54 factor